MKHLIKYIFLFAFVFCLFSCGSQADKSTLTITFNNKEYTEDFTINIDAEDVDFTGNIVIQAKHFLKDAETSDGFEFSCDKVQIKSNSSKEALLETGKMIYLGNYTIKAKSLISSSLDKSITIRLISNLQTFTLSYLNTLINESGNVDGNTRKITLERGQSYTFKATANDGASIKTLIPASEDDSIVYFNNIESNTFLLNVAGKEGELVKVNIKAGYTEIALSFYVEIQETSDAEIEDYIDTSIPDKVLSFLANDKNNIDKSYKYQINITTYANNRDIQFSTDAVKIIAEVDSGYSTDYSVSYKKGDVLLPGTLAFDRYLQDYPNTTPEPNENATWYKQTEYTVSGEKDDLKGTVELFKLNVNGIDRTFSIIPLSDTIWNNSTRNRKTYIYFKWQDDTTYRWKVRIMIGGVFESLDVFQIKDGKEETLTEDGYIQKTGESINWKLRVKYNPTTFKDNETIFYLSDTDKTTDYKIDGKTISLPKPILSTNTQLLNTLSFLERLNVDVLSSDASYSRQTGDGTTNNQFKVEQGIKFLATDEGIKDVDIQMSNNGETVYIVVFSTKTYAWKIIKVSSDVEAQCVNKSLSCYGDQTRSSRNRNLLSLVENAYVLDNLTNKNLEKTGISGYRATGDNTIQAYPKTISDYNKNYRKFYLPINSELNLQMDANFEIESISISYQGDANHYITCNSSIDETQDNKRANIKITSAWRQIVMSEDPATFEKYWIPFYKDYLTDKIGIFFTVTLTTTDNKSYDFVFQFVIFDYNAT